jgi:hypothetical protein
MKIYLSLLVCCIFLSCDVKSQSKEVVNTSVPTFPEEITRLNLQRQYDNTRWALYCIHCDQSVQFLPTSSIHEQLTFGELPIKFDHLEVRGDTVEIDCYFYYKDRPLNVRIIRREPYWGAVFVNNPDSIVLYSSTSSLRYEYRKCLDPTVPCRYREVNPLQPEVVDYIKKNKGKIDPWFRNEAIKRGVIND